MRDNHVCSPLRVFVVSLSNSPQNIEDIYDGVPTAGDDSACVKLGEGVTANVYKIQHKKTGTE